MFRQFVAGCASVPGQISPSVPANEIRGSDAGQSNERGNWRISGETTDVVRPLAVTCPLLPRVRSSTSIKPPRSLLLFSSFSQLVPLPDIKSISPAHHGRRCRCYQFRP